MRKLNDFKDRIQHLPVLASGYTNVTDAHRLISLFASDSITPAGFKAGDSA